MKKVLVLVLISLIFNGCSNSLPNEIKDDIADIIQSLKNNDLERFNSYLVTKEMIDVIYLNSPNSKKKQLTKLYGYHFNFDKVEYFKFIKEQRKSNEWTSLKDFKVGIIDINKTIKDNNDVGMYVILYLGKLDESSYLIFSLSCVNYKGKNYYSFPPLGEKNLGRVDKDNYNGDDDLENELFVNYDYVFEY